MGGGENVPVGGGDGEVRKCVGGIMSAAWCGESVGVGAGGTGWWKGSGGWTTVSVVG